MSGGGTAAQRGGEGQQIQNAWKHAEFAELRQLVEDVRNLEVPKSKVFPVGCMMAGRGRESMCECVSVFVHCCTAAGGGAAADILKHRTLEQIQMCMRSDRTHQ